MTYEEVFALTNYARQAMMLEVSASPKPGLVDRLNSGAHKDMNYYTFLRSSNAVFNGLYRCALVGIALSGAKSSELLGKLRIIGKECEQEMFRETGGVNTHKGLIFSFGILLAATAGLIEGGMELYREENSSHICQEVKRITKNLCRDDFKGLKEKKSLSSGEAIYKEYGIKGIRGEVESGFLTVRQWGLPMFNREDIKAFGLNRLLLQVLMTFMANNQDTNLISRGGIEGLYYAKKEANKFLSSGGAYEKEYYTYLSSLNEEFIKRNISPGGSADLLAVAIFLAFIDGRI